MRRTSQCLLAWCSLAACVRDLFAHASQVQLARMVYAMCARREELLSV
jgi:hypothetical protein